MVCSGLRPARPHSAKKNLSCAFLPFFLRPQPGWSIQRERESPMIKDDQGGPLGGKSWCNFGENTSIWFWPFRPLLLIWTLSTLTFSTSLINLDSFNFELFDLLKFSLQMTSVQITGYFHFYALMDYHCIKVKVGLMLVGCWIWNKIIVSDKYHVLEVIISDR